MARTTLSSIVVVGIATLAPCLVGADLGAALRKSAVRAAATAASLPADAPLSSSIVIPLHRFGPRNHQGAAGASFYVGTVSVGHPPQDLQVMFDTSSGHVLLPHRACKSAACIEHRRYSPWESSTAMDMNFNGSRVQPGHRLARGHVSREAATVGYTQSDLGDGDAKAVLVRDSLCVGSGASGQACVDMGLLTAISLQDVPFRAMPNDGIIGLGLESLAAGPICSFFGRLLEGSRNVLPQFGIAFGAESGELHLGGHDTSRLASPLQWFPVYHPEDGYWQVAVQAVRVGNITVDDCRRGCHGIVDTGVSRLGVQAGNLPRLRETLASALSGHGGCHGPALVFDLGGTTLTLEAKDYTDAACAPQLGPLNLDEPKFNGVYTFGETVLRRYYAAFDWEQRKLGFAPLTATSGEVSSVFVF
mmetsp:Transcript_68667/g.172998  ORF Transcript_68667/g.172998 Transcript_68667/m.172998 type:complete len:418 (-) Transcript_68667:249-1502(-)